MDGTGHINHRRAEELVLENEARLELELDGAYVGLFEWDLATNQSKWSEGFYTLHGLEAGGPASYEIWRSQVHPDDIERVEAEIRNGIDEAGLVDVDYRILHPDGEIRWTSLRAKVERNGQRVPVVMRGYSGDITRRRLADAALLEAEKLAIAGRMSAALAHEINNPLEAAYNLLYLARGLAAQGEQAELLDETLEQLRRVSEISHQTLRFARPAKPRSVKASEVVESTLRLLGPKLRMSSVEVVADYRQSSMLWCSPGEMQQILTNVLNNAAEASREARTVTIRVRDSIEWANREEHGVRITISDTGPGMTAETLHRFREPFYTTKDGTGSGLGMWVVQELVKKMNGALSIRSGTLQRSHGTTISLFFPAVRVSANALNESPAV